LVRDDCHVIERHRVERARQILDRQVETGAAARESTQRSTIAQAYRNHAITGSDPRVRILQRLTNLIHSELEPDIREIGSDGRTFALHQMAGHALSLPEEKLLAG